MNTKLAGFMTRRQVLASASLTPVLTTSLSTATTESQAGKAGGNTILSYRISAPLWETDKDFARLLHFLTVHRAAVDEISLFDEPFPRRACASLDRLRPAIELLGRRIEQLHTAGIRKAGINVILTLGHQDIPCEYMAPLEVPPMVGHDGKVSDACACPNSPEFRSYIKARYAMTARAKPDFIWVDDDMRMSHHGVAYPCFCPLCLKKFGHESDRAALVAKLNSPDEMKLRQAWTEFCATSLEGVCADIRQGVAEVDPAIDLGLMTIGYSHSTWGGDPFARCMTAMAARRGRPGHGYYVDEMPRGILNKAYDVGRQVRDYPAGVKIIEYELENYPFIALDKAVRTVLNECAVSMMMGCNGIAFDALRESPGTLEDYDPLMRGIAAERAVWGMLAEACAGLPLSGFWPADHRLLMANRAVDERGWFWEHGAYDIQAPNPVADVGLPLTTEPKSACGVLLAGKVAEAFTDSELREMLGKGVLMDGRALRVLWARGLGELTGVKPGQPFEFGVTERLTSHELNGRYAGDGREAMVTPAEGVCSLEPAANGVGDLARLIRYDGADAGSCFSVYKNSLGGRVAVSTYAPWRALGRGAKRRQLLAVADWLATGNLPAIVEENVRVTPFVRQSLDGRRVAVILLNGALEPTGPITMRLRSHPARIVLVSPEGTRLLSASRQQKDLVIRVPSIPAWHTAVLLGS